MYELINCQHSVNQRTDRSKNGGKLKMQSSGIQHRSSIIDFRWLLLLVFVAGAAHADITRKVKTTSQFLGTSETTSIQYYTVDRSADEFTIQWTSGIMKTLKGGKPKTSITITRLDKELVWTVNPKKKRYSEMTFAEYREQLKKSEDEMKDAEVEEAETAEEDTSEASEDEYEWTIEVQSDPDPRTINGWVCRNVKILTTGTHKEEHRDIIWITIDNWNSPDVPGTQEIQEFNTRYLKALGIDEYALTPGLTSFMNAYKQQFEKLGKESGETPGESVTSAIEIKRNQRVGPSAKEIAKDAAVKKLTGKIPFGKKKKKKEERWEEKVKFMVTTELLEASTDPVDASKFEVPEGYKKK